MTTDNVLPSEQIQEGNKLIAEFSNYLDNGPAAKYCYDENIMLYHSSWDWLMPVVEKINSLQVPKDSRGDVTYVVTIEPGYCVISQGGEGIVFEKQAFDSGLPLIAIVYEAVVEFIKYHNSNIQP